MKLTEPTYCNFRDRFNGLHLGNVWIAIDAENLGMSKISYKDRKGYFFDYLHRLLSDGKAKFGAHGEFLSGSIEEQLSMLDNIFPKDQEQMEDGSYDGLWFLSCCPFGIVWINDDGYEDWT